VRFKKGPFFTWRRFATFTLYGGTVYFGIKFVFSYLHLDITVEILDEDEDKGEQDAQPQEEEEHEGPFYADEDSTFIPLTWATKLPRTFYRGSDPEWQDFVKMAKDKPRHKKIQDELVRLVYTGSTQHPAILRQLGTEPKVGKYWLDITFPDAPPQEYERSGIEIGDGFVAWSQQKVSPEHQWRLTRALWPKPAFDSLWATFKTVSGIQYRRVKQMLGWEGKDPSSPEERYRHMSNMMMKQQQAHEQNRMAGTHTNRNGSSVDAVAGAAGAATLDGKSSVANAEKKTWLRQILDQIYDPSIDFPIAAHVFASTLSRSWNPKRMEPPRGTFVVHGLVEVRGARGRMLFDVRGCYDPKASKFVLVQAAVRNFKRWNQSPRGGP